MQKGVSSWQHKQLQQGALHTNPPGATFAADQWQHADFKHKASKPHQAAA
jgi:hypothetical protein